MERKLVFLFGAVLVMSLFLSMNISAAENVSESEDSLLTSAPENGKGMSFKEIEDKAGTVPGEAFYFLDRAFDTFKSSEKLADERAYELAVLANKSAEGEDVDNKTMEKARERYEKVMEKVRRRTRSREDTSERVANSTTNHLEALSMVYEKVPEQAKGAIENAMNRSMKGREEALNSLSNFNESKSEKMRNKTNQRIRNRVSEVAMNKIGGLKEVEQAQIRAMRMNIKCDLFPEEFNVSDLPGELRNRTQSETIDRQQALEMVRNMAMEDMESIQEEIQTEDMSEDQIRQKVREKIQQRVELAKDTAEALNENYGKGMGYWKNHYSCPEEGDKGPSQETPGRPGKEQGKNDTSCETVEDCEGLHHIAVPGEWACVDNECVWETEEGKEINRTEENDSRDMEDNMSENETEINETL